MTITKTSLAALAVLALASSTAHAQATRTWVSGVGDDANPCSRTAPCKTFAGAISKTAAGGEINAIDPGGFGAVTITKAITLNGSGSLTSTLFTSTNGVVVNAGANDVVVLRGLYLQGAGTGLNGVRFLRGKALHVEDCLIQGGTLAGISFQPDAAQTTPAQLLVRSTTIRDFAAAGILVQSAGAAVPRVSIEKCVIAGSNVGIDAGGSSQVTVHDTTLTGNAVAGIRVQNDAAVNVDHGMIAHNGTGVLTEPGTPAGTPTARISEVMVSGNATGVSGNVASFGNNRLAAGNAADGAPATTIPQQ